MGGLPCRYPIFIQLSTGRASNSAQRTLLNLTGLLTLTLTKALYPGVSPSLSPGLPLLAPRVAHQECSTVTGRVMVYPGCGREAYSPGYTTYRVVGRHIGRYTPCTTLGIHPLCTYPTCTTLGIPPW